MQSERDSSSATPRDQINPPNAQKKKGLLAGRKNKERDDTVDAFLVRQKPDIRVDGGEASKQAIIG